MFARVAPEHKLRIVEALRSAGDIVAMTGDGVNDAPALKSADIGVAMGITGTEVSKEAAKMILADDNFATIVTAVREGRGIFSSIRKFLRYLLSSNMGEVLTMFFGVMLAAQLALDDTGEVIAAPLLATHILWINLLTDTAPALALGVDPPVEDVMAKRPRRLTDRVIDREMQVGVVLSGVVMAIADPRRVGRHVDGWLARGRWRHRRGAHHGVHDAGARAAVQLLQQQVVARDGVPGAVLESAVVGGGGVLVRSAGAGGSPSVPEHGIRDHRAVVRTVVAVSGARQRGADRR